MPRHLQLIASLILGILVGLGLHSLDPNSALGSGGQWAAANVFAPLGQLFLRLIFMVIVPLVFFALVHGVLELFEGHGVTRVLKKTLIYTLVFSSLSVMVGVGLVNLMQPGVDAGLTPPTEKSETVARIESQAESAKSGLWAVIELVPRNPIESAVKAFQGEIIAWMVFALFFGVALGKLKQTLPELALAKIFDEALQTCMIIIGFAMKLAPLGVFCLVTTTMAAGGLSLLGSLAMYVFCVVLGLTLHQLLVYGVALRWVAGMSQFEFLRHTRTALLQAFSTASGNATLPESLRVAEKELKLRPSISRFVLTVGATANQNGTALFEGITVLFLAQVYGINLDLGQQVQVVLMSILAGVGTAGVPGGSLPLIAVLLQSLGIPAEGLGLILGVDRFLDMCRTTLNVSGDLVIATLVNHHEHSHRS